MNYAIIVAAGKGKRMESKVNKILLMLNDRPIIYHSIKPFQDSPLKELPGLRGSVTWNNIGYIGGIIFSSFNVLYWLSRILDIEIYLLFYAFSFLNLVIPFLFAAGYLRLGSEMKYVKFLNTESGVIVEITEPKPTVKTIEEVHPCPNCGTRIIQDEKFCFKCGKRIEGI